MQAARLTLIPLGRGDLGARIEVLSFIPTGKGMAKHLARKNFDYGVSCHFRSGSAISPGSCLISCPARCFPSDWAGFHIFIKFHAKCLARLCTKSGCAAQGSPQPAAFREPGQSAFHHPPAGRIAWRADVVPGLFPQCAGYGPQWLLPAQNQRSTPSACRRDRCVARAPWPISPRADHLPQLSHRPAAPQPVSPVHYPDR